MCGCLEVVLVVARSGRMLAQKLNALGYRVLVIDCYADLDMQAVVWDWRQVDSLSLDVVQPVFLQLAGRYSIDAVVYGSGFEGEVETLHFLQQQCVLLGNTATVFQSLQDKIQFFKALKSLNIPHPEVRFDSPLKMDGWLLKPYASEGGVGIRRAVSATSGYSGYWQRYMSGHAMSALFLAWPDQVEIIGFHRQWVSSVNNDNPFLFAGVVAESAFPVALIRQVLAWLTQLTQLYGLRGLNSLDFIYANNTIWVLEINARLSASVQLYEEKIVAAHIMACLAKKPQISYNKRLFGAYKIVYAECLRRVRNNLIWPDEVRDKPPPGSLIQPGEPMCSLVVLDDNTKSIKQQLAVTERQLIDYMTDRC